MTKDEILKMTKDEMKNLRYWSQPPQIPPRRASPASPAITMKRK